MTTNQRIQLLPIKFEVGLVQQALDNCFYWNFRKDRTAHNKSPHREVDDIWIRYGDWNDPYVQSNVGPFPMRWYFRDLQKVIEPIAQQLIEYVGGIDLGLVLITRIRPAKRVYPHIDKGWHSDTYTKYCVCIKANQQQVFCFPESGDELRTVDGEVFWFNNKFSHSVTNHSVSDRISCIICVKTPRGIQQP